MSLNIIFLSLPISLPDKKLLPCPEEINKDGRTLNVISYGGVDSSK